MNGGRTEEDVLRLIELNSNVSLSEGNSSAGKGVVEVFIEPEEKFLEHGPFRLLGFGSLEAVEDVSAVSDTVANRNAFALKWEFLTDISVVSGLLVGFQSELAVEDIIPLSVVIKRVSINFELDSLDHALSWEVAIEDIISNRLSGIHQFTIVLDITEILELSEHFGGGIDGVLNRSVQKRNSSIDLVVLVHNNR